MTRSRFFIRLLLAAAFGMMALEGVYIAAAQWFLASSTFQSLLTQTDGSLTITVKDPKSYFPGLLTGNDFSISGRSSDLAWSVRSDRVSVSVALFPLFAKHIVISKIEAPLVALSLDDRQGLASTKEKIESASPSASPEKAEPSTPPSRDDSKKSEKEAPWSFAIRKLHIGSLNDIVYDQYRLKGSLTADLSFENDASGAFSIPLSTLQGQGLVLEAETQPLATIKDLSWSVELPQKDWSHTQSLAIAKAVTTKAELEAVIPNHQVLNYFFRGHDWLNLSGQGGRIKASLSVAKGEFQNGSRFEITSAPVSAKFLGQQADGQGALNWVVEKNKATLSTHLKTFDVRAEDSKDIAVTGHDFSIELTTPNSLSRNPLEEWHGLIKMPEAKLVDMRYLNHFIPLSLGFAFTSGSGTASFQIEGASTPPEKSGFLHIDAKNIQAHYESMDLKGDITARLELGKVDFKTGDANIKGSKISLSRVTINPTKGDQVPLENWWARLDLISANSRLIKPQGFEGQLRLTLQDARPLLIFYGADTSLPEWVTGQFAGKEVSVTTHVTSDESQLKISDLVAKTAAIEMEGWFRRKQKESRGGVLVTYKNVQLSLHLRNDHTDWKLLGAGSDYRSHREQEAGQ